MYNKYFFNNSIYKWKSKKFELLAYLKKYNYKIIWNNINGYLFINNDVLIINNDLLLIENIRNKAKIN